jgi:hypothetical protein
MTSAPAPKPGIGMGRIHQTSQDQFSPLIPVHWQGHIIVRLEGDVNTEWPSPGAECGNQQNSQAETPAPIPREHANQPLDSAYHLWDPIQGKRLGLHRLVNSQLQPGRITDLDCRAGLTAGMVASMLALETACTCEPVNSRVTFAKY